MAANHTPIRVVIVTMDTHLVSATERARFALQKKMPGLALTIHAASSWTVDAKALKACIDDIARADIVVSMMLFMEDHFLPVIEALRARRLECDAMVCAMSAGEIVTLTRMGSFDMGKPATGLMALLKRLRGNKEKAQTGGAAQMRMLRRLPKILKFIPGSAQDVRAYFLTLQYWLAAQKKICTTWYVASLIAMPKASGQYCVVKKKALSH